MSDNFNRVYWHEAGHFVAHLFNQQLYAAEKVVSIEIIESNNGFYIDYSGELTPARPQEWEISKSSIVNLSKRLATLTYGCYFQAINRNIPFLDCFDANNPHANGYDDAQQFFDALKEFEISAEKIKQLNKILDFHFKELKTNLTLLNIFKVEILNDVHYIENKLPSTDGKRYIVCLQKLTKVLEPFFSSYLNEYKRFLNEIEKILTE